mmetsp:Transcript_121354/g.387921  ORF Transcript_121354/g.387921 Transcript_121354/m.387921 type:complete len:170 (+) Transcript_121354:2653-3162(+)
MWALQGVQRQDSDADPHEESAEGGGEGIGARRYVLVQRGRQDLETDVMYLSTVVARSVRTGESTAYEAARVFVKRRAIVGGGVPKISLFTDRLLPMFTLCVLLGLIWWKFVLPMMRTSRRSWDLEMSSRGGSARSWGGGGSGGGGASSYFPPSVVGMSDTPGGTYGQLR